MLKHLRKGNMLLGVVLLLADAVLIVAAFLLAYEARLNWARVLDFAPLSILLSDGIATLREHAILLLLILPIWEGAIIGAKVFRPSRTAGLFDTVWTVMASILVATGILGAAAFAFQLTFISRGFILAFVFLSALLLAVEKCALIIVFRSARRHNRNLVFVLVVGTGDRAREFVGNIESHPEWGMRVIGLIDRDPERVGETVAGYRVIGRLEDIPRILVDKVVDLVTFVVPRTWIGEIGESVRHCEVQGVDVQVALDLFSHEVGNVRVTSQGRFPVLSLEATAISPWQGAIKRVLDVLLSGGALVVLSPVMLAIAIAIKLDSPGPAIYVQTRSGLRGRKFKLLKFRSMVMAADDLLEELRDQNEMSGAAFKMAGDPRITRTGRILRRLSLDELPQFINVFRGDMSLVGPRPLIASENDKYQEWQRRRMSVRPGLTCLWQINGRNQVDFEHWMELDLQYIDNWSLLGDLKIMAKTLPAMVQGRGAY